MPILTAQYRFQQRFPVPAARAFRWCIDYRPGDLALEGVGGRRRVRRIADDLVILTDTIFRYGKSSLVKTKLVRIRPSEMSWTSTHLTGPHRLSQFWYRIVSDGPRASHLDFTGFHVERNVSSTGAAARAKLAARLAREDARGWKHYAAAMTADLGPSRRK